jgi:tetratricopeptide (TPR) repeat protein
MAAWRALLTRQWLRAQAVFLLALGRSDAALARFEQVLLLRPLDGHALASRAHIYAERGGFGQAASSLHLLTQVCPQEPAGWFNLGYALQQLGQQGQAGVAFRRALAIDPRLDRAWYGLALVLMDARLFQGAADALEKTNALQPMSPHGWFRLAQVRQALDQPEAALKIVEHLRQFEPKVAAQLEKTLDVGAGVHAGRAGHAVDTGHTAYAGRAGHARQAYQNQASKRHETAAAPDRTAHHAA